MKGLCLHSLSNELHKVPAHQARKPARAIKGVDEKLGHWNRFIREHINHKFSFLDDYYCLPLEVFKNFSFDELCKLHYSSTITMDSSVSTLFEADAQHEVVRKIINSMWRWSTSKGTWNEVVDAYNNIRRFSFVDNPDFEIRLDHTTYYNEYGHAKYSRVYLDGVFGFLIYYKGEHVLTIGFSILDKKRILIQQVQSARRNGNRWLYKLPSNRMEFVINRFRTNFVGYDLFLIDGACLVKKTLAGYGRSLDAARRSVGTSASAEEECRTFEEKIEHLTKDGGRLTSFYRNTGQFCLGKTLERFGLAHYLVTI